MQIQRIALGVEYDGTQFHGWQSQKQALRTVQGCLELALSKVAADSIEVTCAGRTDAGVHAWAQVVHFDVQVDRPVDAWVRGGNANLPEDINITWAQVMDPSFHARFSALSRSYQYIILNRPFRSALQREQAFWYRYPLNIEDMQQAANFLLGEQDFSSFRAAECQAQHPRRNIHTIQLRKVQDCVIMDITANAFLHHMVRNIMGVLLPVGGGLKPVDWVEKVLNARDRRSAGVTAPARGLYLVAVDYPSHFNLSNDLSHDFN